MDYNKLWNILNEMGIPDTVPASWETCMQDNKQKLELNMEQWTGSKLGKEYIMALESVCLFNFYAEWRSEVKWSCSVVSNAMWPHGL